MTALAFLPFLAMLLSVARDAAPSSDARIVRGTNRNLSEALQFLREYDADASNMCFRVSSARWQYATNMTDANKRRMIDEQTLKAKFDKLSWKRAAAFDWTQVPDATARRQLRLLATSGRASLPDDKYNEIHHLIAEMKEIYGGVRICPLASGDGRFCDLVLDPDVARLMATSPNPDELAHAWTEWHDKTGPPMKNKFMRYVQLANQAARLNGFLDAGEQMRYQYEDDAFEHELAATWQRLQPLYKELFAYARRKLTAKYGADRVRPGGPIPVHLLGNVWGQDWAQLGDLLAPYPQVAQLDVSDEMRRRGFTPSRMFHAAEEFFTSLGMKAMPPEFWRHSLLDKPTDRKVQCTASAWDFCNRMDYRIKQCTEVDMENFVGAHHEMAHVQYYMQYGEQPFLYRDGANPGFHEAIANAIDLSVFNPGHFLKIGLYRNNSDAHEVDMNFLMTMALRKIAYAPYALLVDRWRFHVYRDGVRTMNSAWWDLRLRYQGVIPPRPRTEQQLDAASKKHIISDVPYTKYYVGLLLEFQVQAALCSAAAHAGPLHACDIYRSREAGRLLSAALSLGRSRDWRDVLRVLTRGKHDRLSADPLLDYFQPLLAWLKTQNRDDAVIGWTTSPADMALFQPLIYKSTCATIAASRIPTLLLVALFATSRLVRSDRCD